MRWAVISVLLLAACASQAGSSPETPGVRTPTPRAATEGTILRGTLGGDAQLEGGCAWVDDGATRWEVAWPDGYEVSFEPLRLTGPDGRTAQEGDRVTVEGSRRTDAMTLCQVGPLWEATTVRFE